MNQFNYSEHWRKAATGDANWSPKLNICSQSPISVDSWNPLSQAKHGNGSKAI